MSILKCKIVPSLFWVHLVRRGPVFIIVTHASFALTTYIAAWDNTQSSNAAYVYITARLYLDVRLTVSLWDVMLQRRGILPTVPGTACLDLPADIKWVSLRSCTPEQRCKSVNVKDAPDRDDFLLSPILLSKVDARRVSRIHLMLPLLCFWTSRIVINIFCQQFHTVGDTPQ